LAENARQALATLRASGLRDSTLVRVFLVNLRSYLALADAVPSPILSRMRRAISSPSCAMRATGSIPTSAPCWS